MQDGDPLALLPGALHRDGCRGSASRLLPLNAATPSRIAGRGQRTRLGEGRVGVACGCGGPGGHGGAPRPYGVGSLVRVFARTTRPCASSDREGAPARPRGRLATPPARRPMSGARPRERAHAATRRPPRRCPAASRRGRGSQPARGPAYRAAVGDRQVGRASRGVGDRHVGRTSCVAGLRARRSSPRATRSGTSPVRGARLTSHARRCSQGGPRPDAHSVTRRPTPRVLAQPYWGRASDPSAAVAVDLAQSPDVGRSESGSAAWPSRQRVGGDVVCLRRRVVLEDDRRGF